MTLIKKLFNLGELMQNFLRLSFLLRENISKKTCIKPKNKFYLRTMSTKSTQIKAAEKVIDGELAKIVGQEQAKARIKQILLGALADEGFMPPVLIVAPPGVGKSHILKIWNALVRCLLEKRVLQFATGEECGTRTSFMEDVLMGHVDGKKAHVSVDEAHEAKKPVLNLFRSLLEPCVNRLNRVLQVPMSDATVTWNPHLNSMTLATNQIDKLDPALVSRCERIDLSLYSDEEMEEILQRALKGANIRFNENTLRLVAMCNRGTARDLIHWQNSIRSFASIAGKNTINKDDIFEIIKRREALPLGVSKAELKTLLYLEKFGPMQLRQLAARNLCESREQSTNEKYLLYRGLITVDVRRKLTTEGRKYLIELRKGGFIKE